MSPSAENQVCFGNPIQAGVLAYQDAITTSPNAWRYRPLAGLAVDLRHLPPHGIDWLASASTAISASDFIACCRRPLRAEARLTVAR